MGSNAHGKLGIRSGAMEFYTTPKLVDSMVGLPVAKASCGWNHTAVVTKEG